MTDNVNHVSYYEKGGVTCIEAIAEATKGLEGIEAVCTGMAIKYLWRWKQKAGHEDLEKAQWYINQIFNNEPESKRSNSELPSQSK